MDITNKIKSIDNTIELQNLYIELNKHHDKDYLDYLFYSLKKYEHIIDLINENKNESYENKIKRLDNKFKENVKNYYKTCIITGRSQIVCEVAHIFPFAESDLEDKYNSNNGILLCRDLHKLFDDKLIKINPIDYRLTLTDQILYDDTLVDYIKYNNNILNINLVSRHYFEKLYQ